MNKGHPIQGFNSMKVRLKRGCQPSASAKIGLFQFHEGPIKTESTNEVVRPTDCFNSMKVRLKPRIKH